MKCAGQNVNEQNFFGVAAFIIKVQRQFLNSARRYLHPINAKVGRCRGPRPQRVLSGA